MPAWSLHACMGAPRLADANNHLSQRSKMSATRLATVGRKVRMARYNSALALTQ